MGAEFEASTSMCSLLDVQDLISMGRPADNTTNMSTNDTSLLQIKLSSIGGELIEFTTEWCLPEQLERSSHIMGGHVFKSRSLSLKTETKGILCEDFFRSTFYRLYLYLKVRETGNFTQIAP